MENLWDKIERYEKGQLTEQEKKQFEQELDKDEALASELQLYKDIEGGLRLKGNEKLRKELQKIHQREVPNLDKPKPRRLSLFYIRVAAAAALVGIIALSYFLLQPSSDPAIIASKYQEPVQWSSATRNAGDPEMEEARQFYESKQYANLLELSTGLATDYIQNPELLVAFASAYQVTGALDTAIQYFSQAKENPLYEDEARWQLALLYLKTGEVEMGVEELQILSTQQGKYQVLAKEILQKLD